MTSLREYLKNKDKKLAKVANSLWDKSGTLHDRQNSPDSNENGRPHVKKVEENICRLLELPSEIDNKKHIDNYSAFEVFILSCSACCHDFDKALKSDLPEGLEHGEGSGDFVVKNKSYFGLTNVQAKAIEKAVSIHDLNPAKFQDKLRKLKTKQAGPDRPYNLQRLAVLLKATDILHCDNSRIQEIGIKPEKLGKKLDKKKYYARCCTYGWSDDGSRIVIQVEPDTNEEKEAIIECFNFMKAEEWPAVEDCLKNYGFPNKLVLEPDFISETENLSEVEKSFNKDIKNYCEKAASLHSTLPVAGFVTRLEVAIDIEDVYVNLRAMVNLQGVAGENYCSAEHAEKDLKVSEKSIDISLLDAFVEIKKREKRGLVILGDPGSGKTTHLKKILLSCLRKSPEKLGLPIGMMPIFLPLRELKDLSKGLDVFVQKQLDKPHLNTPEGFGRRLLERGNILFLLDGLDEVVDIEHRGQVSNWIKDAIKVYSSCRFVVSCRYAGYSKSVKMNKFFLEMHIRPFDSGHADKFVHEWYKVVEKSLAKDTEQAELIAKDKADSLIERLKESDFRSQKVFELTRNPLLLTNICLVHYHRGTLPKKRARLYQECIDVLLQHWHESKDIKIDVTAQEGRRILQPAALWMHQEEKRIYATAEQLAPQIESSLKAVKWTNGSAEDFLKTIKDESGLLTGWSQEHFGFMHLGFQEYLAAREIRRLAFKKPGIQSDIITELASNFGDSWWQEVTLILLALEEPSLFVPFMKEVVKLSAFAEYAGFIETCLEDAAEISMEPFVELLKQNPGKNSRKDKGLWERQLTALRIVERNDSGKIEEIKSILVKHPYDKISNKVKSEHGKRVIATFDELYNINDYELVKISGGTFMMGSYENEEGHYEDEEPVHKVQISDFYMGKYPVTNEDYSRFLRENSDVTEPIVLFI